MRPLRGGAVALAMTALLAACTAVPSSSPPQVVNQVGVAQPSTVPTVTPAPHADPRSIVSDFLTASASTDSHHSAARGFLTAEARQRWADTGVTVVDALQVSNVVNDAVTVTGRKLGALNGSGIFTPSLQGDGGGGDPVPFTFGVKQVSGQWRIDTLQNGVVLTADEFQRIYQQRVLYFYDLAEKHLVPDPRFSELTDPGALASWLMNQLAVGPRPELQSAVSTELPAQSDPTRLAVTMGSPTVVGLPGSGQLDPSTRNRLAAQVALTLQQVTAGAEIVVVDGGAPVAIPQIGGTRFNADSFSDVTAPAVPAPTVYYVHDGAVVDVSGKPLPGDAGSGRVALTSVALANAGDADLRIAATSGPATDARLLVGTQRTGLRPSAVHGALSRPAWAPNLDEVWVGTGSGLLRVGLAGVATAVPVSASGAAVTGRVSAVRLSPEGTRVALVLAQPGGTSQVWVGVVVRTQSQVRVDNLIPISPQGVTIADIAWNDQLKLFAIGRALGSGDAGVFEVQVDGSLWTPRGISNLPQAPDSITVAENQVAWVSAGGTVWEQRASAWASPGRETTFGTNPVYLE